MRICVFIFIWLLRRQVRRVQEYRGLRYVFSYLFGSSVCLLQYLFLFSDKETIAGVGFRVSGSGVSGFGCRVSGTWYSGGIAALMPRGGA